MLNGLCIHIVRARGRPVDVTPIIIKPTIRCRVACLMPCFPRSRGVNGRQNWHELRTHVNPGTTAGLGRRCLESDVWIWKDQ